MRRVRAGLVYAALIALAVVFLFPLLWVLGLSLKTRRALRGQPGRNAVPAHFPSRPDRPA
jgi:ABC-type glycerol-3-phosphate transport system permease component